MPPDTGALVPIFGMVTGVLTTALFFWVVVKVAQSPIGAALARRIHGRGGAVDPELLAEVNQMQDQLDRLRQDLTETQERLDFAERMLAQARTPERLPHN